MENNNNNLEKSKPKYYNENIKKNILEYRRRKKLELGYDINLKYVNAFYKSEKGKLAIKKNYEIKKERMMTYKNWLLDFINY